MKVLREMKKDDKSHDSQSVLCIVVISIVAVAVYGWIISIAWQ